MKKSRIAIIRAALAGATLLASYLGSNTALADYSGTVSSQSPAGYWRFSETAPVVSVSPAAINLGTLGSGRNGTYNGDLAGRGADGIFTNDTAAHFDGGSEYITVPWAASLNTASNWTVETWYAPDFANGNTTCLISSVNAASPRSGWLIYQGANLFNVRFYNKNGTATSLSMNAPIVFTGDYIHLVVTYNGTTVRVYTNGAFCASGTPTGSQNGFVPNDSQPFSIGARSDGGFPNACTEDEVAYYGVLLTTNQIKAHFDAATTNKTGYASQILADSPLLYFRLDEAPLLPTANQGSLGSDYDGSFIYPLVSGFAGPAAPTFPGFESSNVGVSVAGGTGGAGGYVNIPALGLNTNGITITGWINPNGAQAASAGAIMIRSALAAPNGGTTAGLIFDEIGGYDLSYNWDGDDATYSWSSGQTITNGGWNFVSLIVSSNQAIIYAPGSNPSPSTNTHTHAVLAFDGTTFLGTDPAINGMTGGLDEVAIFQRALSVGEVYTEYATAVGGQQPRVFTDLSAPAGTLYAGDSLKLSVDVGGTAPLYYQWKKNGTPITGATNTTYLLTNLVAGGTDSYNVTVTNAISSITSASASISVSPTITPVISNNIVITSRTIYPGGNIKLAVSGFGGGIGYQWQWYGTNLVSQTNASLYLSNIGLTNAGPYRAVLSNSVGVTASALATISVASPAAGSYESVITTDHPLSWWRLDDAPGSTNMLDSEGLNDGIWTGSIGLGVAGALTNNANKAANFNAVSQSWGQINSLPPPAAAGDFTYEAWVRPTDSLNTESVPFSTFRTQYGFYFDKNTDGTWRGRDGYGDLDTGASRQALIGNVTANWTHLVAVYSSAGGHRVYINGQWDGNSYINFSRNLNTPMRIGALDPLQEYGLQKFFTGDIDEVAVYGYALTNSQILTHYLVGLYSTNTPPVFAQQPQSQTVAVGQTATFTSLIEGSPTIGQLWYRNGSPIVVGFTTDTNIPPVTNLVYATSSTLTLTNVSYADAIGKTYQVVATNSSGSATSSVVTLTVTPNPAFVSLTSNLVLHLAFESNYLDTSGKGHNATAVGSPAIVPGIIGSGALQYSTSVDGPLGHGGNVTSANYLNLGVFTPGASDLSFSNNVSFSVAYWFKTPTNTTSGDLPIFASAINSFQNYGLTFAPSYNAGGWSWSLGDGVTYAGLYGAGGSTDDGSWHHLVHTFDRVAGNGITYLDGVKVSTVGITVLGDIDSGNPFCVGQDPTGNYNEAATNSVDDLAVWKNRVLTPSEAYATYYVGKNFGKSFDVISPITIGLTSVSGSQYIVWQTGTLYSADNVAGPYTVIPGATAPYYQIIPTASKKFFRVQ